MAFIKALIRLIVFATVLYFAFINNDLAMFSLWPFDIEVTVSLSVAIVFFVLFGFIWGKFDSWFAYSPLRTALRRQKKENKKLNKEQEKLTKEVEGLQGDISELKEREVSMPKAPLRQRIAYWFKRKKAD